MAGYTLCLAGFALLAWTGLVDLGDASDDCPCKQYLCALIGPDLNPFSEKGFKKVTISTDTWPSEVGWH